MNWIPKIEYTELYTLIPKTITFDSPPEKDPFNEEIKGEYKELMSSSGNFQRQFNYNIKTYDLQFKFQSNAVTTLVTDFITKHALLGGAFKYYTHSDEIEYEIFRLESNTFKKERPIFEDSTLGTFVYNVKFSIIKTLDFVIEIEGADMGQGAIGETQFNLVNNQSSPANITGLLFSTATVRAAFISYSIYRKTTGVGAMEAVESGEIYVAYKAVAGIWELVRSSNGDAGVVITIANSGQLQYTTTDYTGTASVSAIKFRASTIGVEV